MGTTDATPYAANIVALANEAWQRDADKVVMKYTDAEDQWVDVTGREVMDYVDAVAKGLIARGVKVGDSVGIMSRTRYEWTILDFAIWSAGGVPVPIYDTSSKEQVDWICSDAGVGLLFVEHAAHAALAAKVARGESPLKVIEVIDDGALPALAAAGAGISDAQLAERKAATGHDTLATIMYTSGTTGRPKGVRLTHFSYVRHVHGIQQELGDVLYQDGASVLLFLTLAHSLARLVEVALVACGTVMGYCPDTTKLVQLMGTLRPTLVLAVPRVFEKVYNSAEQKAAAGGKVKIFRWAAKQAIEYSEALDTPSGPSAGLKLRHKLAHKLVLHKIHDVLGGRATWAISGSAPLGTRHAHFYRGLGLTVLEGYGLTENNAAATVGRPSDPRIGTVGPALPGIEIRIADDGEILMRGDQLFEGYHHNPEATAEAMRDGWFHTGDMGSMDADGFLTITGRKKELIVTAGGKNVSPAVLEERIRSYSLVSQCVVVGDGKPFIAALITMDTEALPGWLKGNDLPAMTATEAAAHPVVREHIDKAIARANKAVSRAESVRRYEILSEDLTIDNGYLTPSMKVKRDKVIADNAAAIERIYASAPSGD